MVVSNKLTPHCSICWSGGFDSTRVLLESLDNNKFVELLTVIVDDDQKEMDQNLRTLVLKYISEKYPKQLVYNKEILIDINRHRKRKDLTFCICDTFLILQQLFMSITPLMTAAPIVKFGYIKGDDFWHYKTEYLNIFNNVAIAAGKEIEAEFPLEWECKTSISNYYEKNHHKLLYRMREIYKLEIDKSPEHIGKKMI